MMSFIDLNRVLQTILSVLRKTKILLFLKRASTFYLASQIELRSWRYADICTFVELKWIYKKVKSTSNLHTQNEGDKKSPQTRRKFKKERSLSVNSYLLSPPPGDDDDDDDDVDDDNDDDDNDDDDAQSRRRETQGTLPTPRPGNTISGVIILYPVCRNMSLPGNKVFFFPPSFSSDLQPPGGNLRTFSINSEGSRPVSRKTSGNI